MRPDRVVVGVETARARKVMSDIYRPLFLREFPVVFTGLESAEMIKYAANGFLALKISFINEIAALCERVGADVKSVAKGMGLDGRIGNKFLHAGPGSGACARRAIRPLLKCDCVHDRRYLMPQYVGSEAPIWKPAFPARLQRIRNMGITTGTNESVD